MLKHLWLALSAAALLVLSSGCGDDSCNTTADCVTKKGEDYVCNLRRTCVVKPTCSPACSGSTPVCEPDSLQCKACTADNTGCSGATPVCNTAGNNGAGQCITCTATAGCGAGSVCDTTVAGGRCVQCLANTHCGGSTPICNVATKTCKSCLAPSAGCSGATPVCDASGNGGAGQCITCSATAGCSAPTGTCDTSVAGGQCVGCLSDANCTGGAVCETSTKTCKTCTATAGCAQGTVCDVAAANGAGQCVQCLDNSQCGGTTPVCDTTSKTCKSCLADNAGCSGSTPVCAAAGNGGLGQCITCSATAGCGQGTVCDTSVAGGRCVQCVSNNQCGGSTPVCDTTSNTCKTCLSAGNAGCSSATPVCVPAGNGGQGQCITCTATQGCGSGTVCDTSVVGGQCVQCLSNTQCANTSAGGVSTPVCDTGTKTCKACVAGSNAGCGGTTPVCNATGNSGYGQCVTCLGGSNAGCGGTRPVCDTSVAGGQCVQCVSNSTCGGSAPVCDTTSKTCKTCLANGAGCGGTTPVCDTAANSGGGQCVQCLSNASCATGVCDTGRKVCVECLGNNNCQDASRPYCNTTNNTCKSCLATSSGGTGDIGCADPAMPTCDPSGASGNGACVVCTGSRGCSGATPTCDTSVVGGECVACTSDAQCSNLPLTPLCDTATNRCVQCRTNNGSGMTEGCSAGAPFCESGTNVCKTCLTSDNSGCTAPDAQACNGSGNNGLGACVQCTGNTYCSSASATQCNLSTYTCQACLADNAGCSGGTPVCDVSVPVCVECVNSTQCGGTRSLCNTDTKSCRACLADNSGCAGGTPFCDVQADACATCVTNSHCAQPTGVCDRSVAGGQCVECTDNSACSGGTPYCNTTTKSCKTCLADDSGCSGSTPVCNTAGAGGAGACVTCLSGTNEGCSGSTAVCDPSVAGGQCVQCLSDANCGGSTPECDTTSKTCKTCLADNSGCSGSTPICNTSAGGGAGQCVVCTATAGCGGAAPICLNGTQCVQCTSNANCTAVQRCNVATNACENLDVATTSQQIAEVRAATDATGGLALPINGALVTYKKPLTASEVGFFVQAEQQGPAIFVAVDPAMLSPVPNVGDRVNLTVDQVATATGVKQVTALSTFSVVSTGNNVAGLRQDLTNANDLIVTGLTQTQYQSELIKMNTITLTSAFSSSGTGHSQANITTPGYPTGDANLRIRLPATLVTSLDLVQTCVLNINNGVMWQFIGGTNGSTNNTQPSAYSASDLTVVSCPQPNVVSAAALSLTQVRVTFDRNIRAASVQANGSQFTFTNGLTATAAVVSGNQVTLTTTAQTVRQSYTVTVANTVTDTVGGPVGTNTASFLGFTQPAVLMINELNPNLTNDLVELRVITAGSTNNIVLQQDIQSAAVSTPTVLKTFPDIAVAAGDLIVVHMKPSGAPAGSLPTTDETTGKAQHPMATYSANYDTAWDVLGNNTSPTGGITYSSRVIAVRAPNGTIQDAVPFYNATGTPPGTYPEQVQALQAAGKWLPTDCRAQPTDPPLACNTQTLANGVSVEWGALPNNTTAGSNSMQRTSAIDSDQKADWAKVPNTFGSLNAGQ